MSRRRAELLALGRRSQLVVGMSVVTGVLTGLGVAAFERIAADGLFSRVLDAPLPLLAAAPGIGLLLATATLKWAGGGATPSTADEYIRNYHDRERRLDLRTVPARIVASLLTLGLGGPMGYEGPSIYIGASIGSFLQHRLSRFFSREDAKVLLVAGAAAGVAAIFKAPATGALFALEVPYQDDLARRMLLPALIGAGSAYVTYASITSTSPLLPIRGAPPFDLIDLGGAALLGILGGGGARIFAYLLRRAKQMAAGQHRFGQALAAGVVLAVLALLSDSLFHQPLTIGPGYRTVTWALDPKHGIPLILALLAMRFIATATVVAGGGAGGLFIPLVIQGALLGRAVGGLMQQPNSSLFPVIGIAAFLGAGYRVPLAAIMFVAESTGRPGFVVPALIAAAVSQLVMGKRSVSAYQVAARAGHLERRFAMPLTTALETNVLTIPPEATVTEFFWHHLIGNRQKSVPVVDGARYCGMVRMDELDVVPRSEWDTTTVSVIVRDDVPIARPGWQLGEALAAMEKADVDRMAVVEEDGTFVGVVATSEILKLDEILEEQE
jgi:chloride channel protein, CIC family